MKEICQIAKQNNLFILQDACETMKLVIDGKVRKKKKMIFIGV